MRTTVPSILVPVLTLAAALPASGYAQDFVEPEVCDLEITADSAIDWRGLYGRGYEVFEPAEYFEVILVEIRHVGPPCQFFLTAASIDDSFTPSLAGPSGRLVYDLRSEPSGPSIFSPDFLGDQFSRLSGQFAAGVQSQSAILYLAIPPGQAVSGGQYSGQPILRVFRNDMDGPDLLDEVTVDVIVPVPPVLSVELAEAGPGVRTMDIDLGNLGGSVDRTVFFEVRSNAPIKAGVSSQNKGKLAHFAGAPGIPYRLLLGDREIDLENPTGSVELSDTRTRYEFVPLNIQVDGNANAAAGVYSDTVTVTFVVD